MIFANLCYGTLLRLGVLKQLTLPFPSFTWEDSKIIRLTIQQKHPQKA